MKKDAVMKTCGVYVIQLSFCQHLTQQVPLQTMHLESTGILLDYLANMLHNTVAIYSFARFWILKFV